LKKKLANAGLWRPKWWRPAIVVDPHTIDGGYTSNDPKCRKYAIERSLRCIDVANHLGTDLIVLWFAREGSYIRESKNARRCVDILWSRRWTGCWRTTKKIRLAIEAEAQRANGSRLHSDHRPRTGPSPSTREIRNASAA